MHFSPSKLPRTSQEPLLLCKSQLSLHISPQLSAQTAPCSEEGGGECCAWAGSNVHAAVTLQCGLLQERELLVLSKGVQRAHVDTRDMHGSSESHPGCLDVSDSDRPLQICKASDICHMVLSPTNKGFKVRISHSMTSIFIKVICMLLVSDQMHHNNTGWEK